MAIQEAFGRDVHDEAAHKSPITIAPSRINSAVASDAGFAVIR
jgi:hypothetical protein